MNNSLSVVHPELIVEWSKKNLPLTPDGITFGSNKVVWWKGSCGHEWQTSVKARPKGEKCPICSGARAVAGINDLSTLKPGLASEWSKKNEIKPTEVTVGSHKKVIWKCRLGHEWTAYLVAQNSNGAYAKQITNETEVSASGMNLDNFANCKIWLETTDTANRITYAALAEKEQETAVNIVAGAGLNITSENGVQKVVPNTAITNIIVEAVDGYFLPDGYEDGIQGLNGLTVTNITKNGFTILGTPASDVNITLPPATKAVYSMLLSGDGTFTGTCVGYQPINAKEFTITNSGNVDLENVDISITGTDKDKFELSGDGTTTIQPNDTLKVAVAPKDSLATGIYRATLTVTAANAQIATTELQFTVNEHDYVAVVTPPNCTEKGYTTYTCRNCSHSYKGNEVDATGHTWGKWKVIKEATTTETGKKERVCERCDYKEIAVISMISNKEQPTTSTKPDTAVKTGDSTNILLWSMVMVISLAGMLTALFFKRRRNR